MAAASALLATDGLHAHEMPGPLELKGRINHSVCKWCYSTMSVEELAQAASQMGLVSIELLGPDDWPTLAKYDLICAMATTPGQANIPNGWNRIENHEWLIPAYLDYLPKVASAGYPNAICFSGNREGLDDEAGLDNCAKGLQQIMPTAERLGVNVCMELLNSKVNHKDYQCDKTPWGVELVNRIGSDRFLLLYDIYHMQIMEGDVIRTIRDYSEFIGHYHTGGNPGRNEIDETQELNYRAIMQAIVDTGFKGWVAQEFIPTRAPLSSLGQAIMICDV
jgi:hydroxypyruvate isomerase